ncbi:MAG TPA: helix-turn-helix domain-containing protein [Solirubrobacterales bacterium]|nr:helix-turn-helix domain-containing protein [Solirubrobacterales bacterium]
MSPQDGFPHNGHTSNGNSAANSAENGHNGARAAVPVNWERLARATAHPLRVSILEILGIDGGRVLSPSDLSRELQIPLSNTNYHVTELAKSGLIELVRERQVRGATEHFYRLPGTGQAESREEQPTEERAWAMA